MRCYACYTPSHRALVDQHFLASAPEEFGESPFIWEDGPHRLPSGEKVGDIVLRGLCQCSQSGAYDSPGFQATCLDKVEFIIEALYAETAPFLFSDVDVRFYGPVVDDLTTLLGDADMAFQWDGPRGRECSGFMVLRPTPEVLQFWLNVRQYMSATGAMDQDALHATLEASDLGLQTVILPERYWTFGRGDKVWTPGMDVDPPKDLLVHHGNWTVGIENKLALLKAVRAKHALLLDSEEAVKDMRQESPEETAEDLGPVIAAINARLPAPTKEVTKSHERTFSINDVHQILEDERARVATWHNHMPLALVLQFWKGDKHEACELARLLADVEPKKRTDTGFVFARQSNCEMDEELYETQLYVGNKFPYIDLVTDAPEWKGYPGVCADAWVSAAKQLADAYLDGRLPYHSAFFFEADGGPLPPLQCWLDRLKNAHQATLDHGKQFTGARMREKDHLNGTLMMGLRAIIDFPSLQRCPASEAWDIFHAHVIVRESHPTNIIRNEYGVSLTDALYHHYGREAAWITSVKDGSHHHWARQLMEKQRRARLRGKQ